MPTYPPGQTLLIDADDTLWENNIYFEQAIAAYISYLDHQTHTPEQVRQALNQAERETILSHGYGLTSFTQSLITCFERLTQAPVSDHHLDQVRGFAQSIADHEIELLPGVADLLPELVDRHRLILMTKGSQAEQAGKLTRSGLAGLFTSVEIVAEKNATAYLEVAARHACDPAKTWMIGNSPKSDINRPWPPASTPSSSSIKTPGSWNTQRSTPPPQAKSCSRSIPSQNWPPSSNTNQEHPNELDAASFAPLRRVGRRGAALSA